MFPTDVQTAPSNNFSQEGGAMKLLPYIKAEDIRTKVDFHETETFLKEDNEEDVKSDNMLLDDILDCTQHRLKSDDLMIMGQEHDFLAICADNKKSTWEENDNQNEVSSCTTVGNNSMNSSADETYFPEFQGPSNHVEEELHSVEVESLHIMIKFSLPFFTYSIIME